MERVETDLRKLKVADWKIEAIDRRAWRKIVKIFWSINKEM